MTGDEMKIMMAMELLRRARGLMRAANARRAVGAVQKALKSADGARRHAQLKPYRESRRKT